MTSLRVSYAVVFAATVMVAYGLLDRERVSMTPSPQQHFDIKRWLGDWYIQGRVVSCTWSGSREFTNYKVTNKIDHKTYVVSQTGTWRNDGCNSVTSKLTPGKQNGIFIAKDPLGNVWSGDAIVVSTDYKKFSVEWGCVKKSADGTKCSDMWLTVYSRKPNPSPYCWKSLERVLNDLFGLSLTDLERVDQSNPCYSAHGHIAAGDNHF